MVTLSLGRVPLAVACLLAAASLPDGSAHADKLTIGMAGGATSVDPHFYNASPNNSIAMQVFDRLVERTADGHLKPGLATSWEPAGDSAWLFHLRPGVHWQDGVPFTADDVAFSLERARDVPNSPGSFRGFLRSVRAVTVPDPLTVRVETPGPAPGLPSDLVNIAIVSRHAGDGATTADYNAGKATIGTGPYKLLRFVPGDRIELERNPDWWGAAPCWEAVTYRTVSNAAARTVALLSHDVDMIDMPLAADLTRLRADPDVSMVSGPGLRVIYLSPNEAATLPDGEVAATDGGKLPHNPLADPRVRQALSLAIARGAITTRVLEGTATPTAQILPAGTASVLTDWPVPAPAPDRARALLAEAGYPNGFHLTLHVSNDRYPGAPAVAQAIGQMWSRIGVRTSVVATPWSSYSAQVPNFAISFNSLGNATFDASSFLVQSIGTKDPAKGTGAFNDTGYSNSTMDGLVVQASGTIDVQAREDLLRQATRMMLQDAAVIPLYHQSNAWGLRKGLTYEPRLDERTLASDVRTADPTQCHATRTTP